MGRGEGGRVEGKKEGGRGRGKGQGARGKGGRVEREGGRGRRKGEGGRGEWERRWGRFAAQAPRDERSGTSAERRAPRDSRVCYRDDGRCTRRGTQRREWRKRKGKGEGGIWKGEGGRGNV